jgi:hypothetical protein
MQGELGVKGIVDNRHWMRRYTLRRRHYQPVLQMILIYARIANLSNLLSFEQRATNQYRPRYVLTNFVSQIPVVYQTPYMNFPICHHETPAVNVVHK